MNASIASRSYADLAIMIWALQKLRDGHTNDAYEMLEGRVDSEIIRLVASYRQLPGALREQGNLKVILERARDYRRRFPFKHRYQNIDDGVADAFKILDEENTK